MGLEIKGSDEYKFMLAEITKKCDAQATRIVAVVRAGGIEDAKKEVGKYDGMREILTFLEDL